MKRNIALFFLFIAHALTFMYAQGDKIHLQNLTAEDGLSLSQITQIYQDDKGFIWIGTFNGLNRYDGYNFKVFLPEPNNPQSISSHHITSINQDSKGVLWIGTNDGLNRFDFKTEKFYRYTQNLNNPNSISHNLIYSIMEDRSGTLLIGTHNALNIYNRKDDNFTQLKLRIENSTSDFSLRDNLQSISSMTQDNKGNIWLGMWDGLACITAEGKEFEKLQNDSYSVKNIISQPITSILEDHSKNIWIGTNGKGLAKLDARSGKIKFYEFSTNNPNSLSNNYVNVVFRDRFNEIWIGTKNGLNKYDTKNDQFIRIYNEPDKPLSIINNEIMTMFEDNAGLIWVGTAGGISRFYTPTNKFNYYTTNMNNSGLSLSNNRVNSIYIDSKENILIGTLEGLDKIINNGTNTIHYKNEPGNKNSISNNYVMDIIEDKSGYIWVGTNQDGLNCINTTSGEIQKFVHDGNDPQSLSNPGITDIFEDHKGTIWVGTWYGLNRFNKRTNKFTRYINNHEDEKSLSNNLIWKIYEDSQKMLWIGTDGGGVCLMDPKITAFKVFKHDSSGQNTISNNRVFSIMEARDGTMWFGTADGLNSYNRQTKSFKVYKKENGLSGNVVTCVIEDNNGMLWIATDNGISKFDRTSGKFIIYTKKDGLKEVEFSTRSAAKSKAGILYFGSTAGVLFFNPEEIIQQEYKAPIVLTDLKVYNQSVQISPDKNSILKQSITTAKEIEIPYESDVITINYAMLYYSNTRGNNYSYKLVGFENNWNDVGTRSSATYTNLPPGEYTFLVKSTNGNGINSNGEASIKITIIPTIYQTWLFKIIVLIGLVVTIFLVVHGRTRTIKKQNRALELHVAERTKDLDKTISELNLEVNERKKAELKVLTSLQEKEELLEEKEILLKEIHHRVKNNLQVISSLLFLQSETIKEEEMKSLFDDSRNRIKSMALIHEKLYQSRDFSEINMYDYIGSLLSQLKESYSNKKIPIRDFIKIDHSIKFNLDTAISCGLLINELITNAYKYAFPRSWINQNSLGHECKIEVQIDSLGKNKYELSVMDNGVGIPNNFDIENTDSLGLKIVSSMVHQLSGSMKLNNENGTQFKIIFDAGV